ncbi:MAG: beta-lactamase family protein [Actinobacteria bacterium]|nr:beta-lactamase family protein [Actinomycetota bacterium]
MVRGWLAELAPRLEVDVAAFVSDHPAPGVAAGVAADGELAWWFGHGFADIETGTRPDEHTPFRVASITKTFTATAMAQLRDAGALSFDDPLVEHLPELAKAADPFGPIEDVTIRLVLMHRSGLTAEPPLQDWAAGHFPSVQETLAAADLLEVVVPPGSAVKYSNLGFQLLGEVVARAAGVPFRACVTERILAPLGMRESGFETPEGAATGYDRSPFADAPETSDGRAKPTDAEGGLWSTVADMARWLCFQVEGDPGVLATGTLRELHRPAVVTDDAWTSAQGLGWYHDRRGERVYVGHSGGTPGFSGRLAFARPDGVGVVVLANGSAPATDLALGLADRVVDARRAHRATEPPTLPEPVPEGVRDYLGRYVWPGFDEALRVEWRAGALTLVWTGGAPPHPTLEATEAPDAFVIRGGRETGERCRFVRDERGSVTRADVAGHPLARLHVLGGPGD